MLFLEKARMQGGCPAQVLRQTPRNPAQLISQGTSITFLRSLRRGAFLSLDARAPREDESFWQLDGMLKRLERKRLHQARSTVHQIQQAFLVVKKRPKGEKVWQQGKRLRKPRPQICRQFLGWRHGANCENGTPPGRNGRKKLRLIRQPRGFSLRSSSNWCPSG